MNKQVMNIKKLADQLKATLLDSHIEQDYWLGGQTTYKVGGNASLYLCINSFEDLSKLVELGRNLDVPILILGRGSNMLVADSGFNGIAIALGQDFEKANISKTQIYAGGACALPVVARQSAKAGLGGLEWGVGIPGSIGGAVRMNAGGHGSDISGLLKNAQIADIRTGEISTYPVKDLQLNYRKSAILNHQIVTTVVLELFFKSATKAMKEIKEIVRWRRKNQPSTKNAGSVFKNPPNISAGELLDLAGAKELAIASARVSPKHANFIEVSPDGKAEDVFRLMSKMKELVRKHSGIELEPETTMVNFIPEEL